MPLLKAHYKPHHRMKHEANARVIEKMIGTYTLVHHEAETGRALDNVYDASVQTAVAEFIAPHVRLHVMQIIRFVAFLLSELGYVAQARRLDDVPYLSEFFAIFKNDDNYLKGRKSWSIYNP